jgi:hypothetical protein
MATIEILAWKDFVGGSGWDAHAKSELSRRLRSGMDAPQHEIRRLTRRIHSRELVSLQQVREEAVLGVTQILQVTGAETRVTFDDAKR